VPAWLACALGAGEGDQPGARQQPLDFIDLAAAADEECGYDGKTGPGRGRGYGQRSRQQAQRSGVGDGLRPTANPELAVDLAIVRLDGVEAQEQLIGGLLIRQPVGQPGQDLFFAFG
jgi:hypothetical protein